MSVLINLLPDTRQVKLREARRRQLATGIAVAIWMVCGVVVGILALSSASQKLVINNLSKDIETKTNQLKGTEGLIEALTAQQHLASVTKLYDERVYITKFLSAYTESNPADLVLGSLTLDESNLLTASGNSKSYVAIAKLARALEAQNVTIGKSASENNQPYFTNVAITSTSRSNAQVSFTITANLAPGVTSGN